MGDGEETRTDHPEVPAQSVDSTPTVLNVKPVQAPSFSEQSTKANTQKWVETRRRKKKHKDRKASNERHGKTKLAIRKKVGSLWGGSKKRDDDSPGLATYALLAGALGLLGYAMFKK